MQQYYNFLSFLDDMFHFKHFDLTLATARAHSRRMAKADAICCKISQCWSGPSGVCRYEREVYDYLSFDLLLFQEGKFLTKQCDFRHPTCHRAWSMGTISQLKLQRSICAIL
jgi:hypothetical protein